MKSRIKSNEPPCAPWHRTSISGPPNILNRAKQLAAKQEVTFSALVVNVLKSYVAKHDRRMKI